MAPRSRRKSLVDSPGETLSNLPESASNLPSMIRFPLAVLINLSLSALLYTLASTFIAGDLATASRSIIAWREVAGLISCRILELGIAWWGDYDGYDIAALSILTRFPPLYLLTTHYLVRSTTVLTALLIDVSTTYIPFTLLRRTTAVHSSQQPKGSVANRAVLNDLPTQALVSALAAGAYALVYTGYCWTVLPGALAVHFEGLRDLGPAYSAQVIGQGLYFLPLGVAAKTFLFTPSIGARPDARDRKRREFDPVTAGLWETVVWNAWGFSVRERVLVERAVVAAAVVGANTFVEVFATVEGVDAAGAAIWSSIWAVGGLLASGLMLWVGEVDEVKN